jgi:predicted ester cyclase
MTDAEEIRMSETAVPTAVSTRQVLERYHEELWVRRNTDALAELVDEDFVDDSRTDFAQPGPLYAKAFFNGLFAAFPDLTSQQEQLITEGDLAATRWTLTGTMTGPLWGMSATGKAFRVVGMDSVQVKNGKILRDWGGMADQLPKILQQVGSQAG